MKLLKSLLYTGFVAGAVATDVLTPDKVEADIHTDKLQNVLWNLNKIAKDNGGNRAFGFPGYNASLDFILERAVTRFGAHMDTYVQPFTSLFEFTREIKLTGPDGEDAYVITFTFNTGTPLPGGITGPLLLVPVDDERGSGCFPDQWEGIDATDKIVLVKRGVCGIAEKIKLAKAQGAVAFILYNQTPGKPVTGATLLAENLGLLVPAGGITLEDGEAWSARLAAGEELVVTLVVDSIAEDRESWNIISETKEGDPNNVVMLGAHLDSVPAGAGINDDGSGSAALLELMGSFKKYKGFPNKVRFAWWGAEESGLVGSNYYGSQLTPEEADKIRFYFNYDMIGSLEADYAVYADTDAHKVGGDILLEYLQKNGKDAFYGGFGTSSDYVAFLELGIPSSGIFTGAGAPQDVCYHQECDDLDNINWDAITVNTKAAGRAAAQFALSLDGVPPRDTTSLNTRSKKGMARNINKWAQVTKIVDKTHSCGGEHKNTV